MVKPTHIFLLPLIILFFLTASRLLIDYPSSEECDCHVGTHIFILGFVFVGSSTHTLFVKFIVSQVVYENKKRYARTL